MTREEKQLMLKDLCGRVPYVTFVYVDWHETEEWSEEDETALGDLLWCIRQAAKSAKDENDMGNVWFAEHWVKNRLKSIRPQPKQEWNEEDEENIPNCI